MYSIFSNVGLGIPRLLSHAREIAIAWIQGSFVFTFGLLTQEHFHAGTPILVNPSHILFPSVSATQEAVLRRSTSGCSFSIRASASLYVLVSDSEIMRREKEKAIIFYTMIAR